MGHTIRKLDVISTLSFTAAGCQNSEPHQVDFSKLIRMSKLQHTDGNIYSCPSMSLNTSIKKKHPFEFYFTPSKDS